MEVFPFVGRGPLLAELDDALAAARAGRGGLVLLTGPAGAGKTRLADETVVRAPDFRSVWAWCAADQTLGGWAQVVRALAALDEEGGRRVSASPTLRALLAGRAPAGSRSRDPGGARLRLAGEVQELLLLSAAETPLLVVLDDLHDADESSLRLLLDLAGALRTGRVLLLGTARDTRPDWSGREEQQAALVRRSRPLPVGPLRPADIAELVGAAVGRAARPEEVDALAERTGGEAFFVVEAVRAWRSGAPERPVDGRPAPDALRDAGPESVPGSVRAAVLDRLRRLPPEGVAAVEAASVLGPRFRLDVLQELVGVPLPGLRTLLSSAEDAGLLAPTRIGLGRFRHELLQEAVHAGLAPSEREALHGRAAGILAALAERGREVEAASVARQLLLSGVEPTQAAAWMRRAGDEAVGVLAHEEAVRWYERADQAPGLPPEDRADLLIALGSARLGAGDRAAARAAFLRAADLARGVGRFDLLAQAALGLGAGATGFEVELLDRTQIELLREARSRLEPSGLAATVAARLSVAASFSAPESERLALAEEAVLTARRFGDRAALGYALSALCDAQAGPDHCADRRRWAGEIVELARALPELTLELLGRRLRFVALLELGELVEADSEALAFAAGARLLHQPLYSWYVPLWQGMRALLAGRREDCLAALAQVEELGRQADSGNAAMLAGTQRWCLLAGRGEFAEVERTLAAMPPLDEMGGLWPRVSSALLAAQLGRTAEAREQLLAVAPKLSEAPKDSEWLPMLAQAVETIELAGPVAPAGELYDALSPYAGLLVVEGIGAAIRGTVHGCLAVLADALGQERVAARHRADALEQATALGAPGLLGHAAGTAAGAGPPGGQSDAGPDRAFRQEGELWLLRFAGREARLRDSKGLRDLATLLAAPGRPVPALDLLTPLPATPRPADEARPQGDPGRLSPAGDLGPTLDAAARAAYRRRLLELDREADEADAVGDLERSARVAWERDALVGQLSSAYGLGGRVRRSGSAAERARTTVTARIRAALDRIAEVHPELARHLRASVRTGTLCVYEPETPRPWEL
ncbi:ATP-binding protein [Streptacidiphilus rugosus]|uniref:ATP-binding protein n=1 Tax=Streptacidiphilus rugosus TaxID=405783 RepID=UPI000568799D|nr:AAA family ATPase [Streptacidiphilus rugosus]